MNSKVFVRSLLAALLCATLLWAGDPWKDKPYTEWTEKEVRKVFQDSPWARPVATLVIQEQVVAVPRVGGAGPPMPMDVDSLGTTVSSSDRVKSFVIVQWASSRTIREAIVRQHQLQGRYNEEQAKQFLSASPAGHVLLLFGPDIKRFEEVSEDAMRDSAHLKLKRSKKKISPSSVRVVRRGSELAVVEFRFPRQVDGQPTIEANEKKVTFSFPKRERGNALTTDFDLRKMMRDGKPDL